MEKTLFGKDGYLFLQNDSARELEVHCNNLCIVSKDFSRFANYKDRYFLTVFPNKSFAKRQYLPDGYNAIYRPAVDVYVAYFGSRVLDGLPYVTDGDTYYTTDTHINLYGAYCVYRAWVDRVNTTFGLTILSQDLTITKESVTGLSELGLGIGDLTWSSNLGSQVLEDRSDMYYACEQIPMVYLRYTIQTDGYLRILEYTLVDRTKDHEHSILDWNIVSKYILYCRNEQGLPKKVVIFYDSFLLSTLSLYLHIFRDVYMIKNIFQSTILDRIKPDLVFEFRCERFLL
jgi:hypothetical protein